MHKEGQTSKRTFYYEITTTVGTTRKFTIDNPKEITVDSNALPSIQNELIAFSNVLVSGQSNDISPIISTDLTRNGKSGFDQTINSIEYKDIFMEETVK